MAAAAHEIDAFGKAGLPLREWELKDNTFYQFHADAILALGNAVVDLALEEADGSLLACCQDYGHFEMQREQYGNLANTIDGVEILAAGALPPRSRHIRFLEDRKGACRAYWSVLYEGSRHKAMLLARQINRAQAFEEKEFVGFYTFNSWLIGRLRQELLDLARGRVPVLREFTRQEAIDQAAKQIKMEFVREKEALSLAVRRLQVDGGRYGARHFASDLERGLSRLQEWKTRMPEIIARAEGATRT